ncbi:MAG TPA: YbhB/YbcL family Raf kinase inhibitor-like protein [Candidatus Acidoferrales bacterium]
MRTKLLQSLVVLAIFSVAITATIAAQQQGGAPPPPPSKFKLMSSAYTEGSMIPTQYSCADPNAASPAISWSNPPANATSFAVIFHDTDAAPMKGTMDVTHWIFWGIPASSTSVAAGVKVDASPDGIMQGKNIRGVNGFQPPCPPPGATPHHYIFELYALDAKVDLPAGSSRADLLKAMDGHVVGKATYVGIYGR